MRLLNTPIVEKVVEPLGRRRLIRNLIFGTSVAAITPILGSAPGVSAASLGFKTPQPMKIHQLTGIALKKQLAKIETGAEFKTVTSFLAQHGLNEQNRVVEGLEIYIQNGEYWTMSHSFAFSYTGSTSATINYYENGDSKSVGVALSTGKNSKAIYEISGGKLTQIVNMVDNGTTLTITPTRVNEKPFTIKKSDMQKLYRTEAHVPNTTTVQPAASCECLNICSLIVAAGCGVLGAAVECSAICLGPEDLPCLAICAALLAIYCAVGGINCSNACSSYC